MFIGPKRILLAPAPQRPTWSHDFRRGVLPAGATFTRAGGGRVFAGDGLLKWAPENLCANSEAPGAWNDNQGVAVSTDGTLAPDGITPAGKVTATAGAGYHAANNISLAVMGPGATMTSWIRARKGNTTFVGIGTGADGPWHVAYFNFDTGAWATNTNCTTEAPVDLGDGWWLLGVSYSIATAGQGGIGAGAATGVGAAFPNYTAAGTEHVYVWGGQHYRTPNVSSAYVKTTGGAWHGPRFDHDPVTRQPFGTLAEAQSTNACPYSQNLAGTGWAASEIAVVNNALVAPDGTATAASLTESGATSVRSIQFSTLNFVTDSTYGVSVFVKNLGGTRWVQVGISGGHFVNFQPSTGSIGSISDARVSNVTARQLPDGWWRLGLFVQPGFTGGSSFRLYLVASGTASGGQSYAGDGASAVAVWGVQVETAGVGVTSYIATAGSAVTRSADVLTLPASAAGFDPHQGGVLMATCRVHGYGPLSTCSAFFVGDAGGNDMVGIQPIYGGGVGRDEFWTGGVAQARPQRIMAVPLFGRRRLSLGWSRQKAQPGTDGSLDGTGLSGAYALPDGVTVFFVGCAANGAQLNGTLESVAYWRGAKADAFVQRVSR